MEVVSTVVGIWMSIPTTLPSARCVGLSIMDLEIVVRVPANGEARVVHQRRITTRSKSDAEFEMSTGICNDSSLDLVCRTEPCLEELEDRSVDRRGAFAITSWRDHPYPETRSCSVAPARCCRARSYRVRSCRAVIQSARSLYTSSIERTVSASATASASTSPGVAVSYSRS